MVFGTLSVNNEDSGRRKKVMLNLRNKMEANIIRSSSIKCDYK
jgi:hypothetical protein